MVVALIALFVAVGGTGYAAARLNGRNIVNRSIPGTKLKRNTLGGVEIRESKLGTVPRARTADTARSAATAESAGVANSANTANSATVAASATTATSAETAGNADSLDGTDSKPPFVALKLQAGCTAATDNGTAPPGYFKDAFGIVHLRGMLSCTASNAFTLPPEARPGFVKFFRIARNMTSENTELIIQPDGTAKVFVSGATFGTPSLEGVTFRAGD